MKKIIRQLFSLLLPIAYCIDVLIYKVLKKSAVTVITFHDVDIKDFYKFERIVQHINKRFKFITPQDFIRYMSGEISLSGRHILVTFDDGFKSSKDATENFLNPLGVKAIFFCCPTFLDCGEENYRCFVANNLYRGERSESEILYSEKPMSTSEFSDLISQGHVIGGHTMSHLKLAPPLLLTDREREIKECATYFKKNYDLEPIFFAFPFGSLDCIDVDSLKIIKDTYDFCFSGLRGNIFQNTSPMALLRQSVTLQDPYPLQLALFYGATNPFHYYKRKTYESYCL